MVNWKLYYADGTTYSNEDGLWINAPGHGVLIVIVRDQWGVLERFWLHNHDYYVFRQGAPGNDDRPYPTSDPRDVLLSWGASVPDPFPSQQELHDYLLSVNLRKFFKFGRIVPDAAWEIVAITAINDADFPTGKSPQRRITDPGYVV